MDLLITCLCVALPLILLLKFLAGNKKYPGKLPPGPKPYPVIGNLLELGTQPHRSLAKLAKIYGPIMSLKLGQVTAIVVSSPSMAKEFLQTHDIVISSNRAIPDAVTAHKFADYSIPFLPISNHWRTLRRTLNTHMFNNKKLDANQCIRQKKVQDLLAKVKDSCQVGTSVNIGQLAFMTTMNQLSSNIFSKDLVDSKSDTAKGFKDMVWTFMEEAGRPNIADLFPLLRKFDPQGGRRRMMTCIGNLLEVVNQLVQERVKLRDTTGSMAQNDVLDNVLNICADNNEEFHRDWVERLFLDLFIGGNDTVSNTVEWAMAELLRNPETLLRAQAELRETIGKGIPIEESELTSLPYIQAVFKEVLRLHPPVPLLVPRVVAMDVDICGFTIPKGAQVMINAWAICRDPSVWDDPDTFMPERFLGSDIDFRGRNFESIPFGAGRRICPGLLFAARSVTLTIASLIHSFNWKLEDGMRPHDINMDDQFGITLKKAQPLIAIPLLV